MYLLHPGPHTQQGGPWAKYSLTPMGVRSVPKKPFPSCLSKMATCGAQDGESGRLGDQFDYTSEKPLCLCYPRLSPHWLSWCLLPHSSTSSYALCKRKKCPTKEPGELITLKSGREVQYYQESLCCPFEHSPAQMT